MASTVTIYDENVEWVFSSLSGSYHPADMSNPHTGLVDLVYNNNVGGARNVGNFAAPTPILSDLMSQLSLWFNPSNWAAGRTVILSWGTSGGVQVGSNVTIQNGTFGFNTGLAAYQNVIIPMSSFAVPSGTQVGQLLISSSSGVFVYLLDTVVLTLVTPSNCTPQILEAQATCFDCGLSRKQLAAIESFILAQMGLNIGLFANATASSLLAAATCFNCLNKKQLEMVMIYLLCLLSNQIGFGAGLSLSSNPSALMKLATCFNCGLPNRYMLMIDVYVLSALADNQGLLVSTSPSSLLAAANCSDCLTSKMRESVIDNLFCQLSST